MADSQSRSTSSAGLASHVKPQQPHDNTLMKDFSMGKGDGKDSYSKNSTSQRSWVDQAVLPFLFEALQQISLPSSPHGPILVADLGCASGLNTIRNVTIIVEKLRERFSDISSTPPEFQAFFSDLPANDFNNLFQLFGSEVNGNFFAAGVPGSFFGRLFPRSTVHVFFSTLAIHYLSKIPDAVVEKDSPASNKGDWRLSPQSSLATGIAFQEQASSDLKAFLHARAEELVPGGLLCFAGMGRVCPEPTRQTWDDEFDPDAPDNEATKLMNCADAAWYDLVSKGIITKEQANGLNWPLYARSIEEVVKDVDSYSSYFHVHSAKMVKAKSFPLTDSPVDPVPLVMGTYKALCYELFARHLGNEVNEVFWERFEQNVKIYFESSISRNYEKGNLDIFSVTLIRKE